MTGYRLGYLATAAGLLVGALLGACILGTASSSSGGVRSRTFWPVFGMQDKVLTGDSVLMFTDVSDYECARRCVKELLCIYYFYHAAQRSCAVLPSASRAGAVLQEAPGYILYGLNPGSAAGAPSSSSGIRYCRNDAPTGARGCWKLSTGAAVYVSVGPAGVWTSGSNLALFAKLETYGNPARSSSWVHQHGDIVQVDVGADIVWLVNNSTGLEYRSGNDSALAAGYWGDAAAYGYRLVSVSPQGATWAVGTDGVLHYGLTTTGGTSGTVPGTVGSGLRSVDVGAAGVWVVDDAGRLLHRLGTYGQEGVPGTGWQQVEVGSGVFRSVSSGRDMVVAVDSAGDVWLSSASGPEAPTGLGWVWLGGGLAQAEIYQAADFTVVWATDDREYIYFYIL